MGPIDGQWRASLCGKARRNTLEPLHDERFLLRRCGLRHLESVRVCILRGGHFSGNDSVAHIGVRLQSCALYHELIVDHLCNATVGGTESNTGSIWRARVRCDAKGSLETAAATTRGGSVRHQNDALIPGHRCSDKLTLKGTSSFEKIE